MPQITPPNKEAGSFRDTAKAVLLTLIPVLLLYAGRVGYILEHGADPRYGISWADYAAVAVGFTQWFVLAWICYRALRQNIRPTLSVLYLAVALVWTTIILAVK
jgi:hypothetical protein